MTFRNTSDNWGWLAIGFHWISAIIVIGLFILGLWMVELTYYDDWYKTAPFIHKSIGISLFLLSLARLGWRSFNVTPKKIDTHNNFEKKASSYAHALLYIILFCVMLSGYLISTADGRAIEVFNLFQVPAVIQGIKKQEDIAGVVHLTLAIILMSIALVHAGAAIKHHYIDKDRTLKRMFGR
jgi:cytochrome b561